MPFYLSVCFIGKGEKEKGTVFLTLDLVCLINEKGILPSELDFLFPPRAEDC